MHWFLILLHDPKQLAPQEFYGSLDMESHAACFSTNRMSMSRYLGGGIVAGSLTGSFSRGNTFYSTPHKRPTILI